MATILGIALRKRRRSLGLTQASVAKALNVSRAAVGQWEAGTHEPSTDNLIAVCKILGLTVEAAINGEMFDQIRDDLQKVRNEPNSDTKKAKLENFTAAARDLIQDLTQPYANKIGYRLSQPDKESTFFVMFRNNVLEHPRPLKLSGIEGVYCTTTCDDRMAPKFMKGDFLYINPRDIPRNGDYILVKVEIKIEDGVKISDKLGRSDFCVVGRYCAEEPESILIERFNPHEFIRVKLSAETVVERVCDPYELIAFEEGK